MNAATLSRSPLTAAPRMRVLLALGLFVLAAHLFLLSGGFSGWSLDMFVSRLTDTPTSGQAANPAGEPPPSGPLAQNDLPPPVQTSRVRWIVPKPPEPEPPPPEVVKPPPPPPEPEVVPEPEPQPQPVEEPPAPVLAEGSADTPPVPAGDIALEAPTTQVPGAIASDVAQPAQQPTASAGTVQGGGVGAADAALAPASPPPSADLRYQVEGQAKGFNYHASGKLLWENTGSRYAATMEVRALFLGSRGQASEGGLTDKGLSPERFTDRSRSERAAHFDRPGQRIRYSNNAPDGKWLPGMQDRLSVNFQLAGLFNARPDAFAQGQSLRLPVTSIDMAEVWLFEVGALESLDLPAGPVQARRLTRLPRREFDRKVEIWLAPALAHLPVAMRITEHNGDFVDMRLKELPELAAAPGSPP